MSRSVAYPAILLHYSGKETDEAKAVILDELIRKGSVRVYWESTAPWGWDDVPDAAVEEDTPIVLDDYERDVLDRALDKMEGIGEDKT